MEYQSWTKVDQDVTRLEFTITGWEIRAAMGPTFGPKHMTPSDWIDLLHRIDLLGRMEAAKQEHAKP